MQQVTEQEAVDMTMTDTEVSVEVTVELGRKYKDSITGFIGTATGRHEYLYGDVRVDLEAGTTGDNKIEAYVFDEQRLVEVGKPSQ